MQTPNRKWFAARLTAFTGLALAAVQDGGWHTAETTFAITAVSAAGIAYMLPNSGGGDS